MVVVEAEEAAEAAAVVAACWAAVPEVLARSLAATCFRLQVLSANTSTASASVRLQMDQHQPRSSQKHVPLKTERNADGAHGGAVVVALGVETHCVNPPRRHALLGHPAVMRGELASEETPLGASQVVMALDCLCLQTQRRAPTKAERR